MFYSPGARDADGEQQVAVQALLTRRNDDAHVLIACGIVEVPAGNLAELDTRRAARNSSWIGVSTGSARARGS